MVQGLFLTVLLISAQVVQAASLCQDIFIKESAEPSFVVEDHRQQWLRENPSEGLLFIGSGNSGNVYVYRENSGAFKIAKQYHADRIKLLTRDYNSLKYIKRLFDSDRSHSSSLNVVSPVIIENFRGIQGNRALSMEYVEGINLHKLLTSDEYPRSLRFKATELYQALIIELINDMSLRGISYEIRPEKPTYFMDKLIDGLSVLRIESEPPLFIKTDNLIYNPKDNTLTLVDPY